MKKRKGLIQKFREQHASVRKKEEERIKKESISAYNTPIPPRFVYPTGVDADPSKGNQKRVRVEEATGLPAKDVEKEIAPPETSATISEPASSGAWRRNTDLLDHQRECIEWMEDLYSRAGDNEQVGGLIELDAGLGKTYTAISHIIEDSIKNGEIMNFFVSLLSHCTTHPPLPPTSHHTHTQVA